MTIATIYITHHDGVRHRYDLAVPDFLRRLVRALGMKKAPRQPAARDVAESRRAVFALADRYEALSPSLSAELRAIASR
jgi:hypothetical protein